MIGRKAYVEQWGGHYETYAPYFVYVLTGNADPRKTYSEPLSRTYNLKNYYGWTDPKSAQDYTVDLRPRAGGRPKVVKRPREDQ